MIPDLAGMARSLVAGGHTVAFARYFGAMLNAGQYDAPSQFEAMFVFAVHAKGHETSSAIAAAVKATREAELTV